MCAEILQIEVRDMCDVSAVEGATLLGALPQATALEVAGKAAAGERDEHAVDARHRWRDERRQSLGIGEPLDDQGVQNLQFGRFGRDRGGSRQGAGNGRRRPSARTCAG